LIDALQKYRAIATQIEPIPRNLKEEVAVAENLAAKAAGQEPKPVISY
jgi:hypothetical protein